MVQGKELPDQRRSTAAAGPSIADRFLGTKFGSDVSSLFEGESRDEYIRRISQPKRAMLSIGELGSKIGSYFGDSPEKFEEGQRERELKLAQRQAEIDARKPDPLSDIRDPKGIEKAIDPDPVDFNIKDALDAEQKRADAVREKVQDTDPAAKAPTTGPDGGVAGEVESLRGGQDQPFKRPTDGTSKGQVDYNAQIADLNNRDYSEKVKKMLGEPPKYEKGEEPDFTARAYLALANAGFALAGAKGTKSFGEAFGDAARVGIKDLTEIYKEKRKVEKELRQERNAQKRADYAAKLQRFDLAEKLRKTDLDILNTAADLKLKEERNEISRADANIRRRDMLSRTAMNDTKRSILDLQAKLDNKGQVLIKDVMAELSKLRQIGMKSSTNNMFGVDAKTATAAYNSQLPSIFQQFRGRVVKDGTVMSDAELASLLKISPEQANKNPVMNVGKATVQRQK